MLARSLGDRKRPAQMLKLGVNSIMPAASMTWKPSPAISFSVVKIPLIYLFNDPEIMIRAEFRSKSLERELPLAAPFSTLEKLPIMPKPILIDLSSPKVIVPAACELMDGNAAEVASATNSAHFFILNFISLTPLFKFHQKPSNRTVNYPLNLSCCQISD